MSIIVCGNVQVEIFVIVMIGDGMDAHRVMSYH